MANMHDIIRRKFKFNRRTDNLPFAFKRGNRNVLAELFNDLGYKKGVEVGTRRGDYSLVLCQKIPGVDLTCIDPWAEYRGYPQAVQDAYYDTACKTLAPYNVKFLRMPSMEALSRFTDESLDFAYIDGNHEFDYACPDIIYWSRKVKKNGMIGVHDYNQFHWAGVTQAVDAYVHCHHIDPWYVINDREPTAFWVKP